MSSSRSLTLHILLFYGKHMKPTMPVGLFEIETKFVLSIDNQFHLYCRIFRHPWLMGMIQLRVTLSPLLLEAKMASRKGLVLKLMFGVSLTVLFDVRKLLM